MIPPIVEDKYNGPERRAKYNGPERRAEPPLSAEDHSRMCAANERQINERFSAMFTRFEEGTGRMKRIETSLYELSTKTDDRLDRLDAGMQQNTAVTQEVKEILDAARGAFKFFGHMGNFLKWSLGLGGAALAFWVALKDFRSH